MLHVLNHITTLACVYSVWLTCVTVSVILHPYKLIPFQLPTHLWVPGAFPELIVRTWQSWMEGMAAFFTRAEYRFIVMNILEVASFDGLIKSPFDGVTYIPAGVLIKAFTFKSKIHLKESGRINQEY